jgi:hypothetical protein
VTERLSANACQSWAAKEAGMTRGRAAIAAVMLAVAMALAGAGIASVGQAETTRLSVSDPSLTVEDKVLLVAGDDLLASLGEREERSRGSDQV